MRVNIQIDWKLAPSTGRLSVRNGSLVNGLIALGFGKYERETQQFNFISITEPCRMFFAVDMVDGAAPVCVVDKTPCPFEFDLNSVLQNGKSFPQIGVTIEAETDYWISL